MLSISRQYQILLLLKALYKILSECFESWQSCRQLGYDMWMYLIYRLSIEFHPWVNRKPLGVGLDIFMSPSLVLLCNFIPNCTCANSKGRMQMKVVGVENAMWLRVFSWRYSFCCFDVQCLDEIWWSVVYQVIPQELPMSSCWSSQFHFRNSGFQWST